MVPVRITAEMAQQMANDIMKKAADPKKFVCGKFTYTADFNKSMPGAVEVNFTAEAYDQMFALINYFSSEIAWEGCVERLDETHFRITKIVLYPQKVTGVTVSTTDEDYSNWRMTLPDEIFNSLFFQGHSHVNMGVTPSTTDIADQWRTIDYLQPTDYQIFMIWNKRREFYVKVVDLAANRIYEGSDVKVTIGATDTDSFLEEAKRLVEKQVPVTNYSNGGYQYYSGGVLVGGDTANTTEKEEAKTATGTAGFKTVTGAAAPKVSNLMNQYRENPEVIESNYNHSCKPYLYDDYPNGYDL